MPFSAASAVCNFFFSSLPPVSSMCLVPRACFAAKPKAYPGSQPESRLQDSKLLGLSSFVPPRFPQQTVGFELLCSTSSFPSANCRVCVACLHFCFRFSFVLCAPARRVSGTWGMRRARNTILAMKLHLKGVWLPSFANKIAFSQPHILLCQLEVRCVYG